MRGLPPELTLGDARLDAQHAFLYQLLDQAETLKSAAPAEVAALTKGILLYCKTHFAYEEELMQKAGFPYLAFQQLDHERFSRHCADLATRMGNQRAGAGLAAGMPGALTQQLIVETLRTWLHDHILRPGFGDAAFVLWAKPKPNRPTDLP